MGEEINTYRILVRNPLRKRPIWRPRKRREDNIKIDLKIDCEGNKWIKVA
jgi:hypothetical protein